MYESRSSIFSYIRLTGFSKDRMYERQNVGPDDFLTSGLDCSRYFKLIWNLYHNPQVALYVDSAFHAESNDTLFICVGAIKQKL